MILKARSFHREQLGDASIEIQAYTQALKKVEAQLVAHQQNQLWYEEKIRFMKIDLDDKTDVLTYHKKLLAEAEKEKEESKAKVEKWHNSSKGLNILLNSQIGTRDKAKLGYGNQMHNDVLNYENEVFGSVFDSRSSDIEDSLVNDRYAEGMHVVPPLMIGIYIPSGPDVEIDKSQYTYGQKQSKSSESNAETSNFASCESNFSVKTNESVPKPVANEPKAVSDPKVCRIRESSTVTYTEISSPYEDLSDIGSPGAEGPIFQDPPSPDYVPGPEEPEQAPPSPIYVPFVPEPVYPEFLPEDDVLPVEEQPLPVAASPTTESPGYIPESDPEEDLEEDDEEDPEEDPADYPADRGDDIGM
ncbi:hypothetical protein Tco_1508421 [Tanacetum coccineum]